MSIISGRNWSAIVDNDQFDFEALYDRAIIRLASMMANEKLDELEVEEEEIPEDLRPNLEDPEEVLHMVIEKQPPQWWPSTLGRLNVHLVIRPHGETVDRLSPHPIDPNQRDLGRTEFSNLLKNMLEEAGSPFEGQLQIKITRKRDKANLGGWRGEVYVGEKQKKKKGADRESAEKDEMFELLLARDEKNSEAMHRMFGNASNVIHASASALNAMRGANAPPPWMRGEDGEGGMPMWMFMAKEAMGMVAASGLLNGQAQTPAQVGMNVMQHPVQNPGALGGYGQRQVTQQGYGTPQLQGPTQDNLGYGGYQNHAEPGDFDGVYAHDEDLIDDGFDEEEDEYYEEDEFLYEEDEDEDEDEDEEEEERPRRGRSSRKQSARSGSSKDPLEDMSPEELEKALSRYIDKNPDKKGKLKQLAMGLATKIL